MSFRAFATIFASSVLRSLVPFESDLHLATLAAMMVCELQRKSRNLIPFSGSVSFTITNCSRGLCLKYLKRTKSDVSSILQAVVTCVGHPEIVVHVLVQFCKTLVALSVSAEQISYSEFKEYYTS